MDQVPTKWFWDRVVCAGLLGLALTAGIAAGSQVKDEHFLRRFDLPA